MAEVNATTPIARPDLSESMNKANNFDFNFNGQHYLMNRAPDYFVYIYNVSEQAFEVSRPPILKKMIIPGRTAGAEYALAARLPQPLLTPSGSVDSSEIGIVPQDTRRFAMDIINPDNLGLNQDAVLDPKSITSVGNNLGAKGVFWSLNNPPTKEEISAATKRLEARYNFLLEQARTVEVSAPGTLKDVLTPEHHAAVEYYGLETSWHGKRSKPMDCPNCGERIKQGVAFHKTEEGGLCVLDWVRAVKAGVRTKAQAIEAGAPGFEAPAAVTVPSDDSKA